ncbi:MAG: DNA modification methylase, partial [Candidatus Glassbacteria bacterium]|nr:DNA modification methylase [Candidatus Glassbacteria bacterium]
MNINLAEEQLWLFDVEKKSKKSKSSTFLENLSLPVHRWFRYSAGFSALWVRDLIRRENSKEGRHKVLDPFAGSGTVMLESELCNVHSIGIEAHPFVSRISRTKLYWRENATVFYEFARSILEDAKKSGGDTSGYPKLIEKCF